jgi:hypothetical protein
LHAPDVQVSPLAHALHAPPFLPQAAVEVPVWQVPAASQQPVGQLTASHTHAPPTQCLPPVQGVFPPQRHAPPAEHVSAPIPQLVHDEPLAPHVAVDAVWQLPFASQQPLQVAGPQLHAAPTQATDPPVHNGCVPQRQTPLVQRSEFATSHGAHAVPPVPHSVKDGVLQAPVASQQPVGQLVASHTQLAPEQRCPGAHAAPDPHWQLPLVQLSPVAPQSTHALPPAPHDAAELPAWHDPFWQQPVGQLALSQPQLPLVQCWPALHAESHGSVGLVTRYDQLAALDVCDEAQIVAWPVAVAVQVHCDPLKQKSLFEQVQAPVTLR